MFLSVLRQADNESGTSREINKESELAEESWKTGVIFGIGEPRITHLSDGRENRRSSRGDYELSSIRKNVTTARSPWALENISEVPHKMHGRGSHSIPY